MGHHKVGARTYTKADDNRYVTAKYKDAEAKSRRKKVRIGDIVMRPWDVNNFEHTGKPKMKWSRVIYIHPQGYYHVVQFETKSGVPVREAFSGTDL